MSESIERHCWSVSGAPVCVALDRSGTLYCECGRTCVECDANRPAHLAMLERERLARRPHGAAEVPANRPQNRRINLHVQEAPDRCTATISAGGEEAGCGD